MPHRATFLTNDGVFDHKRAGAGQNRRHLQKQLPTNRGQANRSPASPSAPSTRSVWSDKFVSLGRTARQPRSNGSSAFNPHRTVRQPGSNSSSAQINQFLTYALRTLTSIGAQTAHAIKFIGKQTKRREAHGKRYHERHKQNRELHDRPLSAHPRKTPHHSSATKGSRPFPRVQEKPDLLKSSCRMNVKTKQSAGQK